MYTCTDCSNVYIRKDKYDQHRNSCQGIASFYSPLTMVDLPSHNNVHPPNVETVDREIFDPYAEIIYPVNMEIADHFHLEAVVPENLLPVNPENLVPTNPENVVPVPII